MGNELASVILLSTAAYLLGAVPAAYLAGKWARGVDLRRYGSGNVGIANLGAITSWRVIVPVVIFDLGKGVIFLLVAHRMRLSLGSQAVIGLAPIVGHAWSVYLGFQGGRGVLTTMSVAFTLPAINGLIPWEILVYITSAATSLAVLHSTPVGVMAGVASFPLISTASGKPLPITLGFLAMFGISLTRRLAVRRAAEASGLDWKRLVLYRALLDRDIRDRQAWKARSYPSR